MVETNGNSEIRMAFALGERRASISFLDVLPSKLRSDAEAALALSLLSRLWSQYREDRRLNHGRTLFSSDNSFELRVFLELITEAAGWAALRSAAELVRRIAPPLSPAEQSLRDAWLTESKELMDLLSQWVERDWGMRTPAQRLDKIVEGCLKYEDVYEDGVCWALNILTALDKSDVGLTERKLPSPSLLRREMFRLDRSSKWRADALCHSIATSCERSSDEIRNVLASLAAFDVAFPARRKHSRLKTGFLAVLGAGEVSVSSLGRWVGCTGAGARKMLESLAKERLARPLPSSLGFVSIPKIRSRSRDGNGWLSASSIGDVGAFEFGD